MSISLYAMNDTLPIEVGRYGMSLEAAKNAFLDVCKRFGADIERIECEDIGRSINIRLPSNDKINKNILHKVAFVEDIHGDPPTAYTLTANEDIPDREYVMTGSY